MQIVSGSSGRNDGGHPESLFDPRFIFPCTSFGAVIDLRLEAANQDGFDLRKLPGQWLSKEKIARLLRLEVRSSALAAMIKLDCGYPNILGLDFERGILVHDIGTLISLKVTGYRRTAMHFLADLCQSSRVVIDAGPEPIILYPTLASHFVGWWPDGYEEVTRTVHSLIAVRD